ncbi:hypothetical protein ARMGADRAFT_1040934 [Armillaria gallica]|uniref:Uncharacterized protein n=1 Tax=Armillaria gallica TaxID=47427 RepID=A0A2H3C873_ARMGA|nr:hypothetical protein ARMGADRAFT_1040934 [Armillaria gallica]
MKVPQTRHILLLKQCVTRLGLFGRRGKAAVEGGFKGIAGDGLAQIRERSEILHRQDVSLSGEQDQDCLGTRHQNLQGTVRYGLEKHQDGVVSQDLSLGDPTVTAPSGLLSGMWQAKPCSPYQRNTGEFYSVDDVLRALVYKTRSNDTDPPEEKLWDVAPFKLRVLRANSVFPSWAKNVFVLFTFIPKAISITLEPLYLFDGYRSSSESAPTPHPPGGQENFASDPCELAFICVLRGWSSGLFTAYYHHKISESPNRSSISRKRSSIARKRLTKLGNERKCDSYLCTYLAMVLLKNLLAVYEVRIICNDYCQPVEQKVPRYPLHLMVLQVEFPKDVHKEDRQVDLWVLHELKEVDRKHGDPVVFVLAMEVDRPVGRIFLAKAGDEGVNLQEGNDELG